MLKHLFLFFCLYSSAFCFEKGAEFFESGDYLKSAQAFLTEARINDARVPFYIKHLSETNLINPQDLGADLEQKWQDRLQNHVPFAPIVLGRGEVYLQISLLAQKLYVISLSQAESILQQITTISSENKIGYGYYVIGRFLEKQSINKSLANRIVSAYEKGAEFAHRLSILSLVGLPKKFPKFLAKLKIEQMYIQESKALSDPKFSVGAQEKTLSRYYDKGAQTSYGIFMRSVSRKGLWQYEGARQGDAELQVAFSAHCSVYQKLLSIAPIKDDEADRWMYFAALGEEPQAQAELGQYFLFGDKSLFPEDKPRALLLFEAAILTFTKNQQVEKSNGLLKMCYANAASLLDKGEFVPQNDEIAFKYFKIATDLFEDPDSTYNVGCMLDNGRGVLQNQDEARTYYEKAAKLGDSSAMQLIGHRLLLGTGGYAKDPKKALIYLNIAATKNNPQALLDLGGIYGRHLKGVEEETYPVPQDNGKSLDYLKRSAQAGNEIAQQIWASRVFENRDRLLENEANLLVECLEKQSLQHLILKSYFAQLLRTGYRGIVPYDGERALKLLQEVEHEGDQLASLILGTIYELGDCGVAKDYDRARKYYETSQEIPQSISNLGFHYEMGYGSLIQDGKKAKKLYKQALEMKCGSAAHNLGVLYQKGKFVEKSEAQAFYYFQRGHELGDSDASYQYAIYLYSGLCCDKNTQGATEILLNLDTSSPTVAYTLAAIQWNNHETKSPLIFQKLGEEGMPLAQHTYGLLLYATHLDAQDNVRNMRDESGRFIKLAGQNGIQAAQSALRLLIERSSIEKEEAKLIIDKLLLLDIEGARDVRHQYAQGMHDEKEQESQMEASLMHTAESLAERDPEVAKMRQEQYLAYFMDPLNRKNVSVKGLYKIAAAQVVQKGGRIAPARGGGSGVNIKVGDNATGFHGMHRSGQSSRATLDPGRANSFRNFVGDITQ